MVKPSFRLLGHIGRIGVLFDFIASESTVFTLKMNLTS